MHSVRQGRTLEAIQDAATIHLAADEETVAKQSSDVAEYNPEQPRQTDPLPSRDLLSANRRFTPHTPDTWGTGSSHVRKALQLSTKTRQLAARLVLGNKQAKRYKQDKNSERTDAYPI